MTQASRADRAPLPLRGLALVVGVVFVTPVAYVLWRVVTLDGDFSEVWKESMGPLWRTIQLAVIVSVATGVIGTGLAWLLVRTDVPFARVLRLLAPLPLVFPSFVGAAAFLAGLGPEGAIRGVMTFIGYDVPTRFRGLGASCFVLTAFTYPYVYLPVAARLAGLPPSLEESARLLGDRPSRFFFRVVLPAIRSSVLGGMLIAMLYSLSDFGAVQLLGFDTLTRVVYATRLVDRAQSFAAATLLLILAIIAVVIERRMRGSLRHSAPPACAATRPCRSDDGGCRRSPLSSASCWSRSSRRLPRLRSGHGEGSAARRALSRRSATSSPSFASLCGRRHGWVWSPQL